MSPAAFVRLLIVAVIVGVLIVLALLLQGARERREAVRRAEMPFRLVEGGSFPPDGQPLLRNPRSLAVVGRSVFVAEADAARVSVFDLDGRRFGEIRLTRAGSPVYPAGVAALGRGTLLIVDPGTPNVLAVPSDPGTRTVQPWGSRALAQPTAIAVSGDRVAVADAGSGLVELFDEDGAPTGMVGRGLSPRLTFVGGLAMSDDEVFVADSNAGRVISLDADGGGSSTVRMRFALPRGLALLPGGRLAVADAFGGVVKVLSPTGAVLAEARLDRPEDVEYSAVDRTLYVCDAGVGKVRVFRVVNVDE